jgi:hypothetical protein
VVSTPEAPTPAGGDNGDNGGHDGYNDNVIDDYEAEIARHKRTSNGFMLCAIIAIVLLIPAAYFSITLGMQKKTIEDNLEIVESARRIFEDENSMLQRNAEDLVTELEGLKDQNDTMMLKYQEAVVMLEQLQREKTYNYEQLAKYKKEVATLRNVMKGYLRQIDSLNTINKKVIGENVSLRKEISTANLRADVAEERATELENRVQQGAVLRARDIAMVCLNAKDKVVSRISRAYKLRVDLTLSANELANPGNRMVYVVIITPDGYPLASEPIRNFDYQGDKKVYSAAREVDYQNEDVDVSIYYDGSGFVAGDYKIAVYTDGNMVGSSTVTMR